MNKDELKRMIRAMNSILNLHDVEGLSDPLISLMSEPVDKVAKLLNIPEQTKVENGEEVVIKYLVPENFEEWYETYGRLAEKGTV